MNQNKTQSILCAVICTLFISVAQIFYKRGADTLSLDIYAIIMNYNIWIGLFLYTIGAVFMVFSMRNAELSTIYPILALSYVWVSLLAAWFLPVPEKMNLFKWSGVFFILAGVSCIGFGKEK